MGTWTVVLWPWVGCDGERRGGMAETRVNWSQGMGVKVEKVTTTGRMLLNKAMGGRVMLVFGKWP